MHIYYLILYFFTYAFLGWCTEVAYAAVKERRFINRGFLNGPLCPIYGVGVSAVIVLLEPFRENWLLLYLASVVLVTLIEGLTGWFLDRIFHHKWWDYSKQPMNIGGYVCVLFSLIWGVACVFIIKAAHPLIHKALSLLPEFIGMALIIILCAVLAADIYVTVSGILKFNQRLEIIQKIAAELHELSDKVGENIYENVMETMEKTEEGKKKLESKAEESRKYTAELKERYEQLVKDGTKAGSRVSERLMKAFPNMHSSKYKDILEEVKEALAQRRKKSK